MFTLTEGQPLAFSIKFLLKLVAMVTVTLILILKLFSQLQSLYISQISNLKLHCQLLDYVNHDNKSASSGFIEEL